MKLAVKKSKLAVSCTEACTEGRLPVAGPGEARPGGPAASSGASAGAGARQPCEQQRGLADFFRRSLTAIFIENASFSKKKWVSISLMFVEFD